MESTNQRVEPMLCEETVEVASTVNVVHFDETRDPIAMPLAEAPFGNEVESQSHYHH